MSTDHPTNEAAHGQPAADHALVEHYEIRVGGHLASRWSSWFDGLSLTTDDDGTTVLRGPVVDQAALHGLLERLRDLGITLLSLTRIAPGEAIEPPIFPHTQNRPNPPGATS